MLKGRLPQKVRNKTEKLGPDTGKMWYGPNIFTICTSNVLLYIFYPVVLDLLKTLKTIFNLNYYWWVLTEKHLGDVSSLNK